MSVLSIIGTIAAILAGLLHVFIFYMESIAWTSKKARSTFGMTKEEANNTKEMAFNQGFYNLMLAVETLIGVCFMFFGNAIGKPLAVFGVLSMFSAAALLFFSSPDKRSAAIKQGTLPLIALILLFL